MIKDASWTCELCQKVTLTWYIKHDTWDEAFGLARHHLNPITPDNPVDDYDVVVSIWVHDGEAELVGFLGQQTGPKIQVYTSVFNYLSSLGLKVLPFDRAKRIKRGKSCLELAAQP